jgi:hypothetical protein
MKETSEMLHFGNNFNYTETSMQNTQKTTSGFWNTFLEIDRKGIIGTDRLKYKEVLIYSQEEKEHPSYNKKKRG